jgi:hypothetical protein
VVDLTLEARTKAELDKSIANHLANQERLNTEMASVPLGEWTPPPPPPPPVEPSLTQEQLDAIAADEAQNVRLENIQTLKVATDLQNLAVSLGLTPTAEQQADLADLINTVFTETQRDDFRALVRKGRRL